MLRRFLDSFRARVFDLNYDDVGEGIAGDVRDGFPRSGDAVEFDYEDMRGEDGRTEWCHLHGSVRYEMRTRIAGIVKHPSREAAAATFGDTLHIIAPDKEVAPQGPIISGFRKLGNTRLEPFPLYYQRFVSALLDCPRLLIIGYGGTDDHIATWLWQWRRIYGDRARLVWVTRRCDMREPRQDLLFPQFAAGNGESAGIRYITADDVARGELRTENAYVVFTGSPLCDEDVERAIDFLNSNG